MKKFKKSILVPHFESFASWIHQVNFTIFLENISLKDLLWLINGYKMIFKHLKYEIIIEKLQMN